MDRATSLQIRAWRAVLACPAMVAGLVPGLIAAGGSAPAGRFAWLALVPGGAGLALLASCVRRFAVEGRGTLAPWDPPTALVHGGLYARVRNPMYLAVLLVLVAWVVAFPSIGLGLYAAGVAAAFHLRVVLYEEPVLRRQFGPAFDAYCARVPRWIPKP